MQRYVEDELVHARTGDTGECLNEFHKVDSGIAGALGGSMAQVNELDTIVIQIQDREE